MQLQGWSWALMVTSCVGLGKCLSSEAQFTNTLDWWVVIFGGFVPSWNPSAKNSARHTVISKTISECLGEWIHLAKLVLPLTWGTLSLREDET